MQGKLKDDIGIRNLYEEYKQQQNKRNKNILLYNIYNTIIKKFNLKVRESLLNGSNISLPFRLGKLQIVKSERKFKILKSVNWKLTKEHGFKIYHEQPYSYYLKWDKMKCVIKNKTRYNFKACRTLNRLIAESITKNNRDYYFLQR